MTRFLIIALIFVCFYEGRTQVTTDSARYISAYGADSLLERSLQDYYSKGHFDKLLRKQGIKKITCAGCDAVYVELIFCIDKNGKVQPMKLVSSTLCHGKKSETFIKDFYQSLNALTLPKQFSGQPYRYRFGRALKC